MGKNKELDYQKHIRIVTKYYVNFVENINNELEQDNSLSVNILLGELTKIINEDFAYTVVDDCIKAQMVPEKVQMIVNIMVKGMGVCIGNGTGKAFEDNGIKANIHIINGEKEKND